MRSPESDANNMLAMQVKRKLERLGAKQVEMSRGDISDPEASVVADVGDHVILRSDLLVRITAPDEFIVQIPTQTARLIGIKDSLAIHGIEQLNALLARVMTAT